MPKSRKNRKLSPSAKGYIAYYRVSTARQGASGLGLDAQRDAVLRLAKETPILAEYTEVESGKRHENRPQLLAALADAKKRGVVLLIAKLDRLARNVHLVSGLMETGVDFIAADLPQANRLTVHIMAAMAEHEREMISERTQAGMEAARREIEQNGFRISKAGRKFSAFGNPRWQESIAKARAARLPAPAPAVLLEMMRERRLEGATLRQIAAHLNALGLHTPAGRHWYASTVRKAMLEDGGQIPDRPTPAALPAEILAIMHHMRSDSATLRTIAGRLNELGLKSAKGKNWYASTVRAAMLTPSS